jgi:hypothetical protein
MHQAIRITHHSLDHEGKKGERGGPADPPIE